MKILIILFSSFYFAYLTSGFVITTDLAAFSTIYDKNTDFSDMVASSTTDFESDMPESFSTSTYEQISSEKGEKKGESSDVPKSVGDKSTLFWYNASDIKIDGSEPFATESEDPNGSSAVTASTTEASPGMPTENTGSNKPEFVKTPSEESNTLMTEGKVEASGLVTTKTEITTPQLPVSPEQEFADDEKFGEDNNEISVEIREDETVGDVNLINGRTESMDNRSEECASSCKNDLSDVLDFNEKHDIGDPIVEKYHEINEIANIPFEFNESDNYKNLLLNSVDKDEFHPSEKRIQKNLEAPENLLGKSTEKPLSTVGDTELGTIWEGNGNMNGKDQTLPKGNEEPCLVSTTSNGDDGQDICTAGTPLEECASNQEIREGLATLKRSINQSFRIVKLDILKAAESLNNAVESLGSALENFVEKLRNNLQKSSDRDQSEVDILNKGACRS